MKYLGTARNGMGFEMSHFYRTDNLRLRNMLHLVHMLLVLVTISCINMCMLMVCFIMLIL